ncbi:helix-turn-helix transcriptional regulator [Actinomycetospora sp. NBRC 106375]|nr:helix-turn-helix transcriptional regulator [Actinomycetospora sp. NBRC 106375]
MVRACHRGRDVEGVRREVLSALRRVMTIDAAFFATADPETLLFTGAMADDPLAAAQGLFLDNEFSGADVNTFTALVAAPGHVATLDQATRRERSTSPRYREIMAPMGLGDELRAALVVDDRCWGYLCLHREDGARGFEPADATLLSRVAPHVAEALRRAALLHGATLLAADTGPGVVLLDDHLELVAATPRADELMGVVAEARPPGLPVPAPVHTAAAALLALERGTGTLPPRARARARGGGWLHVHAARLQGGGAAPIAVVIEHADAHATAPLLLAAHGLTPRETDVARLVLRGVPTAGIVDALHISPHTVQDHLKAVFDKVGVRSRRELMGRLLATAPH